MEMKTQDILDELKRRWYRVRYKVRKLDLTPYDFWDGYIAEEKLLKRYIDDFEKQKELKSLPLYQSNDIEKPLH